MNSIKFFFQIRDLLDRILPLLYAETVVKQELIKEVEMGPFKHVIDGGLDLRKAAFEWLIFFLFCCLMLFFSDSAGI